MKKDFPGKVTDYLDGFQYENGALQFVPTAEGYYDFVKQRYVYNYTDHLGNVRLSYTKNNNGALEILEENNYYAFGLKHKGYGGVNLGNPNYHYKYNGKELQENSMYDYGARLYMPDIGRWNTIDPLAEKYPNISPYTYVANNPINAIDPDGRDIIFISKTGQQLVYSKGHFYYASIYKDKDGNYITRNTGKKYDGRTDNVSVTLFRLARVYRDIEHSKNNILKTQLHTLENSDNLHIIREGSDNSVTRSFSLEKNGHLINIGRKETDSNHTLTTFNFSKEDKKTFQDLEKVISTDETTIIHEMRHQYDYEIGNMGDTQQKSSYKSPAEIRAVYNENLWRKEKGLPIRSTYGGKKIDANLLNNPPNNKNSK